jgi:hypothetical protein
LSQLKLTPSVVVGDAGGTLVLVEFFHHMVDGFNQKKRGAGGIVIFNFIFPSDCRWIQSENRRCGRKTFLYKKDFSQPNTCGGSIDHRKNLPWPED